MRENEAGKGLSSTLLSRIQVQIVDDFVHVSRRVTHYGIPDLVAGTWPG
jgi:predicted component of type VI protein secretion system